eukprot:6200197-Pleurochrysis_carterae.AAC.6
MAVQVDQLRNKRLSRASRAPARAQRAVASAWRRGVARLACSCGAVSAWARRCRRGRLHVAQQGRGTELKSSAALGAVWMAQIEPRSDCETAAVRSPSISLSLHE